MQRSAVMQFKKCIECGHSHGASECTTNVPVDPNDKSKGTRKCGCKSHSSKWDSGGKFNPGSGKRARMLENKGSAVS